MKIKPLVEKQADVAKKPASPKHEPIKTDRGDFSFRVTKPKGD